MVDEAHCGGAGCSGGFGGRGGDGGGSGFGIGVVVIVVVGVLVCLEVGLVDFAAVFAQF